MIKPEKLVSLSEYAKPDEISSMLHGMFENPYMGFIIINQDGIITMITQSYMDILGVNREDALGHHILEITPHSKLLQVVKTGEIHVAEHWSVNSHDLIVFRIPLYKDGKIIGAMGQSLALNMDAAQILIKRLNDLESELKMYKDEVNNIYSSKYNCDNIIGKSPAMHNLRILARQAAQGNTTVLITGESGTGKELMAHAIHQASPRSRRPFVRVNCAALPENLLESELFGYMDGAFTGARRGGKPGKFELAHHGIIFLDEIGDMPLSMQAKLLIVLQEREIERLGGTKPTRINVQVIAATNQHLEEKVKEGLFREDLYYRLNVLHLYMPPLRQRREDIPLISQHLLKKINQRLNTRIHSITPGADQVLMNYDWPGNIRELENMLERAIIQATLHEDGELKKEHFPFLSGRENKSHAAGETPDILPGTLNDAVEKLEKDMIEKTLRQTNFNKTHTAKLLGMHGSVLYRKIKKYQIAE